MGDSERTQDRQMYRKLGPGMEKVRARCGDAQPSLLLFSIILFIYSASYLYLYSLRPYSFTIL
jgi:hypothetical protein